jgi:hypothetical protein
VLQLAWHGGRGTLACVTEDSTVILNETVMHAYMSGELSVRTFLVLSVHSVVLRCTSPFVL